MRAVDDFLGVDRAAGRYRLLRLRSATRPLRDRAGAAVFVVLIPAGAGFLPEAAHFAQERPSASGGGPGFILGVAEFLADAPADVEAGQVADGEAVPWPCRNRRGLDRPAATVAPSSTRNCASRRYGIDHAVADEPAAVADQHADFPELLGERHAGGDDDFLGGFLAAHDLEAAA